jgi:hypothetical protein
MTKRATRIILGLLIACALLGAYAIAAKDGPQASARGQPAAAFGH